MKFYHFYLSEIAKDTDNTHFENGWKFLHRKRDDLDFEWEAFTLFISRYFYWYICHAAISEIVRFTVPKVSTQFTCVILVIRNIVA